MVLPTVAIELLLLVQVPPVMVLVSGTVLPTHTVLGPLMVPAVALVFTVTLVVAVAVPQLLLTV